MRRIGSIGSDTITRDEVNRENNTTVWEVQRALNTIASRDAVPENGVFDGRTREVIRRFQEGENLSHQDGRIDQETINALNRRAAWVEREDGDEHGVEGGAGDCSGEECEVAAVEIREAAPGLRARSQLGFFGGRSTSSDDIAVEAGLARTRLAVNLGRGHRLVGEGEVLSARGELSAGRRNSAGAEANLAAGGVTLHTRDGESATVGISAGPGAGLAVERTDRDLDGRKETCVTVSASFMTVGVCIEDEP